MFFYCFVQSAKDRRQRFDCRRFPRGFYQRPERGANCRVLLHGFPVPAKLFFCLFRDWHKRKYIIKNSKLKIFVPPCGPTSCSPRTRSDSGPEVGDVHHVLGYTEKKSRVVEEEFCSRGGIDHIHCTALNRTTIRMKSFFVYMSY